VLAADAVGHRHVRSQHPGVSAHQADPVDPDLNDGGRLPGSHPEQVAQEAAQPVRRGLSPTGRTGAAAIAAVAVVLPNESVAAGRPQVPGEGSPLRRRDQPERRRRPAEGGAFASGRHTGERRHLGWAVAHRLAPFS
jgi:hypothetical protein